MSEEANEVKFRHYVLRVNDAVRDIMNEIREIHKR